MRLDRSHVEPSTAARQAGDEGRLGWHRPEHPAGGPGTATFVTPEGSRDVDERSRQAFLAMVGHELRSPITSVMAGAELLQGASLDAATRREVARLLVEEANRIHLLVEQMTTLSVLERVGSHLTAEPVHLVHLARKVGAREAARRACLDLRLPRLTPDPAVVLGDEGFIAQVLTILIDNAAKYAGRKATIDVVIRPAGNEIGLHVLDRGPGLGGGDPDRLFELFQRARADLGGPPGSGIGLYVAKQVVIALKGRVWARDRDGGGADIGFALPAAR